MSNINKKISELNPHVLSIRFTNGITVIDTYFNDGWGLPKSDKIGFEKVPEKENYYMLYPLSEVIGIDEMLDYVSHVIKINIEREKKIVLLQEKINELKVIFSKTTLTKCRTLNFTFKNETLMEDIEFNDIPLIEEDDKDDKEDVIYKVGKGDSQNLNDVNFSEGDNEVKNFNTKVGRINNEIFELPLKKGGEIQLEEFEEIEGICKCNPNDPNEACSICLEY